MQSRKLASQGTELAGQAFAAVFKAIKGVRPVRPIHPRGLGLVGELTRHGMEDRAVAGMPGARSGISWLDTAGTDQVQARFSRSVGLPPAFPDILGLALRIGAGAGGMAGSSDIGAGAGADAEGMEGRQPADILFASTGWGFPARFLLLPKIDVGTAKFTTLMPYKGADGPVLLGLRTLSLPPLPRAALKPAGTSRTRWGRTSGSSRCLSRLPPAGGSTPER